MLWRIPIVSRTFLSLTVALAMLCVVALGASRVHAQNAALSFKIFCARCHGDDGKGDGPDGASLSTHPQDLRDCAAMKKISDDTMFKAIKGGGASVGLPGDMPPWGQGLSDDQIHGLMTYIRGFCKK